MSKKLIGLVLLLLLLALPIAALAQENTTAEGDTAAADDNLSLFGIRVPAGWTDESTPPNIMHLVDPASGAEIFTVVVESTDIQVGIDTALQTVIAENFARRPDTTGELDRANGIWTQYTYNGDETIVATAQRTANDLMYVVVQSGSATALQDSEVALNSVLTDITITPKNGNYLALGLGAAFVLLAALILSLALRYNNVHKDIAVLQRLAEEDAAPA